MTVLDNFDQARRMVPYWYWLVFDAVLAPFILWGLWLSTWFVIPWAFLCVSIALDVTEFLIKRKQGV